jgi:hypothetical protein
MVVWIKHSTDPHPMEVDDASIHYEVLVEKFGKEKVKTYIPKTEKQRFGYLRIDATQSEVLNALKGESLFSVIDIAKHGPDTRKYDIV